MLNVKCQKMKRRRIFYLDDESSLGGTNSRFLHTKKRRRRLELNYQMTDEHDISNFRTHYENNGQKIKKIKINKAKNIIRIR